MLCDALHQGAEGQGAFYLGTGGRGFAMFQTNTNDSQALMQRQLLEQAAASRSLGGNVQGLGALGSLQGFNPSTIANWSTAALSGSLFRPSADASDQAYKQAAAATAAAQAAMNPTDASPQVQEFIGWLAPFLNGATAGDAKQALASAGAGQLASYSPAVNVSQELLANAAAAPTQAAGAGIGGLMSGGPSLLQQASGPMMVDNSAGGPQGQAVGSRPRDEDVQSLLGKVQRRLQQNRESARKCRQRKKAYLQRLEEELLALQAKEQSGSAAPTAPTAAAPAGAPGEASCPGTTSEDAAQAGAVALASLLAWREEYDVTVTKLCEELRGSPMLADEARVRALVESCAELLRKHVPLMEELIKHDMFAVLAGHHLLPEERLVLWMGGIRPSDMLQLVTRELANKHMLETGQAEQLARLQESWSHQEEALQHGFTQLKSTMLSEQLLAGDEAGATGPSPRLLGKMDAMRMLLQRAEGSRTNYHQQLQECLSCRQFAMALVVPATVVAQLRRLRSACSEGR